MFDGGKTETIVLDEVQCKYCLRTVNQKMDLVKHYRFCLGLKGAKKSTAEVSTVSVSLKRKIKNDVVYFLCSECCLNASHVVKSVIMDF